MVKIWKDGEVVSRSKNLRCILDYARKLGYVYFEQKSDDPCVLLCMFRNGARCVTIFSDPYVLNQWIENRYKYSRSYVVNYQVVCKYGRSEICDN